MTDESVTTSPADPDGDGSGFPRGVPQTGNAAVDAILTEVVGVASQPVAEHVAVFERAHERLRAALDSPEA